MMNRKKRQRLNLITDGQLAIVALDNIEIWDGADLALLREVLTDLIERERYHSIAVDLKTVKYIPSGFFGMLYEWYENGIDIQLHSPQPNVEQMLWFRMFFRSQNAGTFFLNDEAVRHHTPGQQVEYHKQEFTTDVDPGKTPDTVELNAQPAGS
jgi:hypothetical protein